MKVNVIIVSENGINRTPFVTKSEEKASAMYEKIAREFLGDDIGYIVGSFSGDSAYEIISHYLDGTGKDIQWFTDVELD